MKNRTPAMTKGVNWNGEIKYKTSATFSYPFDYLTDMNSSFASIAGIAIHVETFQRITKYFIHYYLETNSRTSPISISLVATCV